MGGRGHGKRKKGEGGRVRGLAGRGLGAEGVIGQKRAGPEATHSDVDKRRKSLEKDARRARS